MCECGVAGSASCHTACPVHSTIHHLFESASHHVAASPLCPGCPSPPLLLVWMNVSSLSPWLSDFHAVRFSVSSGCFLFLNCCCPSFGCARRHSVSTYASILAGSSKKFFWWTSEFEINKTLHSILRKCSWVITFHSLFIPLLELMCNHLVSPSLRWMVGPGWCGSLIWFPIRAHAWVAGQVPSRGHTRGNHTLMFLSLSFSLSSPLSKNK